MKALLQILLHLELTRQAQHSCDADSVPVRPDTGVGRLRPSSRLAARGGDTASHPDMLDGGPQ